MFVIGLQVGINVNKGDVMESINSGARSAKFKSVRTVRSHSVHKISGIAGKLRFKRGKLVSWFDLTFTVTRQRKKQCEKAYWKLEPLLLSDSKKDLACATLRSIALNYIASRDPKPPNALLQAINILTWKWRWIKFLTVFRGFFFNRDGFNFCPIAMRGTKHITVYKFPKLKVKLLTNPILLRNSRRPYFFFFNRWLVTFVISWKTKGGDRIEVLLKRLDVLKAFMCSEWSHKDEARDAATCTLGSPKMSMTGFETTRTGIRKSVL